MDNRADLEFWSTQMTLILEQHEGVGRESGAAEEEVQASQTPPTGQKACRYGMACTRNDCKVEHINIYGSIPHKLLTQFSVKSWVTLIRHRCM